MGQVVEGIPTAYALHDLSGRLGIDMPVTENVYQVLEGRRTPQESVADLMGRRLAAYGSGPDRFGLIHADMRLANLLVDGDQVAVIDFDDCGFSWFMYDLGSSLSFIEDHPLVPELIDSWVQGYRSIAPISAEDEAELETFVMFRRLLLGAWIGSHSATELAQEMGEQFTAVSCDLAETYLSRHG